MRDMPDILKMGSWYSKDLGDGIMASVPADEIQDLFKKIYAAAGNPQDMAVFTRLESEGRLHCEMIAYFSPAAKEVAEKVDAQPCERPTREGLGLLAGDPNSWSIVFPEGKE